MSDFRAISLQVNSDLCCLEQVLRQFETVKSDWVNHKDWLQCQLALAEGFTNAVRHAHQDLPKETKIDIQIIITLNAITIKIWDYGKGFNLNQSEQSLTEQNQQLSSGGRGIAILQKIADKLTYDRCEDQRNCLIIYKKIVPTIN